MLTRTLYPRISRISTPSMAIRFGLQVNSARLYLWGIRPIRCSAPVVLIASGLPSKTFWDSMNFVLIVVLRSAIAVALVRLSKGLARRKILSQVRSRGRSFVRCSDTAEGENQIPLPFQ